MCPQIKSCLRLQARCRITPAALFGLLGLRFPANAQVLLDLGPIPPSLGPDDIAQLKNQTFGQSPDGLNYYTDNGVLHPALGEPGQTFTTGTATNQYILTRLAIKTAGI